MDEARHAGGRPMLLPEPVYQRLYERALELYGAAFKDILLSRQHLEQVSRDSFSEERATEVLTMLQERTGLSLRDTRMLEIGAGYCMTLATARCRFGADAHGIEPGDDEYSGSIEVGREVLRATGQPQDVLRIGVGESIPHPDESFDLVFSLNVLEHTNDPPRVIAESLRVLRPGGLMYHIVPNYGSWWEGHYGVPWIPHLNKSFGRLYLRLLGKNPAFLDTLQLISRPWLKRMLNPYRHQIEVLNWGQDLFVHRLRTLDFAEYATLGRLKSILRIVHRLGLVRLVCAVGTLLHWETPLVLTVRKKASLGARQRAA
jgi:SAM-dependent methyltransferase